MFLQAWPLTCIQVVPSDAYLPCGVWIMVEPAEIQVIQTTAYYITVIVHDYAFLNIINGVCIEFMESMSLVA